MAQLAGNPCTYKLTPPHTTPKIMNINIPSYPPPYPEYGFAFQKNDKDKENRYNKAHLIIAILITIVITSACFIGYGCYLNQMYWSRSRNSGNNRSFHFPRVNAASHSFASNIWFNIFICVISVAMLMTDI